MRPLRQRNGSRVIVSPPRETGRGFFMSKRKSGGHAAASPSPPAIICILVVDAIIDEFEVEICCQRTDGVDRVFSTSMDWLRAERPSEYTLAYSVETLLFSIIAGCLTHCELRANIAPCPKSATNEPCAYTSSNGRPS